MSFKEATSWPSVENDQGVQLSPNHNTSLEFESKDISSLRTLIIDNYDSYTFNLLQLWDNEKSIENVVVIRNNQFSWYAYFHNLTYYICLQFTDIKALLIGTNLKKIYSLI